MIDLNPYLDKSIYCLIIIAIVCFMLSGCKREAFLVMPSQEKTIKSDSIIIVTDPLCLCPKIMYPLVDQYGNQVFDKDGNIVVSEHTKEYWKKLYPFFEK